jgi:predicted enzyme related to lactoylglutathione lyase
MKGELRGIVALLEVANVPHSIEFYGAALGLEVHQSAGEGGYVGWAWLRKGDVALMLNAMFDRDEEPGPVDAARAAAHRDTTLYIGCPDLDAAAAYLQAMGVMVSGPVVTTYGMRQLSFFDPDGYGICLQWPAA